MTTQINYLNWYKRRRRFHALIVCFVAICVWVGWSLRLPILTTFFPGFPPMSPLSALAGVLLAVTIFEPRWLHRGILSAMAIGVGLVSLGLLLIPLWPPSDVPLALQFFVDGPTGPGNTFAPFTPLIFVLLATVTTLQHLCRAHRLRQVITISVFFLIYVIFVGHITRAVYVHSFTFFAHVSIPAEIVLFFIALGLLYREGDRGVMKLLTSPTEGGAFARQLLIAVVAFPAITTFVTLIGVRSGYYATSLGTALNIAVNVLFFEIFVWRIGNRLRLSEEGKLRAEAEILVRQQQLERFKQATDASTEGVLMTDVKGNIFYVNAAWENMTGWKLREVSGKNPNILQSGKTDRRVARAMWKAIAAGKTFQSEAIINRRKDGREFDAALNIYPVRQATGGLIFVGLMQDISERKAVERSKTEFVSIASHQLATPLTSMRWTLELLNTTKPLRPEQKHFLNTITNSNLRMIALVNALLNTSRVDVGSFMIVPQPMNLANEIDSVVDELGQDMKQKKLRVNIKVSKGARQYKADPTLFRLLLQNLLTNAIRYTPEKGTITIGLTNSTQRLLVTVADTGFGIPTEDHGKIFTKMFRSANAVASVPNGTGLGLYIVKAVVDRSGGTISYESELGRGTTFTLQWPASGWTARTGTRELSYHPQNEYTA